MTDLPCFLGGNMNGQKLIPRVAIISIYMLYGDISSVTKSDILHSGLNNYDSHMMPTSCVVYMLLNCKILTTWYLQKAQVFYCEPHQSLPVTSSGGRHVASKKQHMMDSIHAGTRLEVNCHEEMIQKGEYKVYICVAPSKERLHLLTAWLSIQLRHFDASMKKCPDT